MSTSKHLLVVVADENIVDPIVPLKKFEIVAINQSIEKAEDDLLGIGSPRGGHAWISQQATKSRTALINYERMRDQKINLTRFLVKDLDQTVTILS